MAVDTYTLSISALLKDVSACLFGTNFGDIENVNTVAKFELICPVVSC